LEIWGWKELHQLLQFPLLLKRWAQLGARWLTPVILTTLEAEIKRIMVHSQPRVNNSTPYFVRLYLGKNKNKNLAHKKGLAEWLKQ
jgi:hypothetical protein